jgi:hypothetical protein
LRDDANARRVVEAAIDSSKFVGCGFDADRIFARVRAGERTHGAIFDAIMRDFAERAGKARWCEKTPLQSATFVWRAFPSAQVVHIVRDPRASLASGLELTGGTDVAGGAQQWRRFTTRNILAGAERGARQYLRVRYEDLTQDPEAQLAVVFAFLGEEFDPAVLTDAERRRSVLTAAVLPWQARILEPIRPTTEAAWRQRLNRRQQARVAAILGDMLPALGYPAPWRSARWLGRALGAMTSPMDAIAKRRFAAARRRLRTPEQFYEVAARNWRLAHEPDAANPVPAKRSRDPAEVIGVWLG